MKLIKITRQNNRPPIKFHYIGCNLYINDSRSFGVIEPQDGNTWKISREPNDDFPLCSGVDETVSIGDIEIQDYPQSFVEPVWNKNYGHVLKNSLHFTITKNLVSLMERMLLPFIKSLLSNRVIQRVIQVYRIQNKTVFLFCLELSVSSFTDSSAKLLYIFSSIREKFPSSQQHIYTFEKGLYPQQTHTMLFQCCNNVGDIQTTLYQRQNDVVCLLYIKVPL